ncbi:aminomethyl-transferring glycine dehydrogenase subunit GcvPB [PVC group bacterium]|nr:aminomethyl-transferring glycine dehydrogenase subunit GcvPB [PVC group bacterium]
MNKKTTESIYKKSVPGRCGVTLPKSDVPSEGAIPPELLRKTPADLPEVSELDVVRHFTELSTKNFSVDGNFYPLGSCTMKYNPKITEKIASLEGFANLHPLLPQLRQGGMLTQGALQVLFETQEVLSEITGMDAFTTQPMAGAHGELTGIMIISAYHRAKGHKRRYVIIPDSAHGTNPATAAIAGYEVITVPSDQQGTIDLEKLKNVLNEDVAALMLTAPNTLGIFNSRIAHIAELAHNVGALIYYDGANMNAILGKARPGDLGFDVVHLNLHKTFSTPHGGGGPGSGPVGVKEALKPYLPISVVEKRDDGTYTLNYDLPDSIGYIAPFYGNFGMILRAYAYIRLLGKEGLKKTSEMAVLNANYIMKRLKPYYTVPYGRTCMHECVLSAQEQAKNHVRALDIAKILLDRGIHAPTVYFPLIVKEAMMIEPTETESLDTLDRFCEIMIELSELAKTDPSRFHEAPLDMPVRRLNEVKAAKDMNLVYQAPGSDKAKPHQTTTTVFPQ